MKSFTYDQLPSRIVFSAGALSQVGTEVERLGATRVMLVHDAMTKLSADSVDSQLGPRLALRWDEVAQHVPVDLAMSKTRTFSIRFLLSLFSHGWAWAPTGSLPPPMDQKKRSALLDSTPI